jgi:hypothetical protein
LPPGDPFEYVGGRRLVAGAFEQDGGAIQIDVRERRPAVFEQAFTDLPEQRCGGGGVIVGELLGLAFCIKLAAFAQRPADQRVVPVAWRLLGLFAVAWRRGWRDVSRAAARTRFRLLACVVVFWRRVILTSAGLGRLGFGRLLALRGLTLRRFDRFGGLTRKGERVGRLCLLQLGRETGERPTELVA